MTGLRARIQALADDLAGRAARTCDGKVCGGMCPGESHHTLETRRTARPRRTHRTRGGTGMTRARIVHRRETECCPVLDTPGTMPETMDACSGVPSGGHLFSCTDRGVLAPQRHLPTRRHRADTGRATRVTRAPRARLRHSRGGEWV